MSVTDVQRDIRRTRALRVAAFLAAALNAVMLAVNTPHGGLVALILAPFSAAAVIGCVVMIVRQTRLIGRWRRALGTLALAEAASIQPSLIRPAAGAPTPAMSVRESVLRRVARRPYRPPLTPEDWRQLREMEIELGWEPSEPPATVAEPARPARKGAPRAAREDEDTPAGGTGGTGQIQITYYPPETGSAPMTGPGGRWHPVSELPEHDAKAAEHFEALHRLLPALRGTGRRPGHH